MIEIINQFKEKILNKIRNYYHDFLSEENKIMSDLQKNYIINEFNPLFDDLLNTIILNMFGKRMVLMKIFLKFILFILN